MTNNPMSPGGAHPIAPERDRHKKRPLWLLLVAALVVLALVALGLILRNRHHNDASSGSGLPVTTTGSASDTSSASSDPSSTTGTTSASADATSGSASAVSSASASTSGTATSSSSGAAGGAGAGTLTAGGDALLPAGGASNDDLSSHIGQQSTAEGVQVLSAPANNGFWSGTSTADEVWVQLLLPGLVSPHPVRKGDHVSFTGTVVHNPADFATTAGLTAATGGARLTGQKAHVEVAKNAISFTE